MDKKTLILSGIALLIVGVLLFLYRDTFAVTLLGASFNYGSVSVPADAEFYKAQIFAYGGVISFLAGLALAVRGFSKD